MLSILQKLRSRRVITYIIGGLVLYAFVCVFLARSYVHPMRNRSGVPPKWVSEVFVNSSSGPVPSWATTRLASGHGKPVVFVLAHGYGGNRLAWGAMMADLSDLGFEAVAPSMPGQDDSPDSSVGFGVKEAQCVLDTVQWVRSHYKSPPKVVLLGVSMGGAATWLASEKDPSVDAVVTEGAFSRFDEVMSHWLNSKLPGSSFYLRPMIWLASADAKVNPATILPVRAAEKWHKPCLVIQAGDDTLIPLHQAQELATASKAPLWIVGGAEHANCYNTARDEYLNRLVLLTKKL